MSVNEVYGLSHEYGGKVKEKNSNTSTKQWKSLADLLERKDHFVTVYSFPLASSNSKSSGSLDKCGRSNVVCSASGGLSSQLWIEEKQNIEYMEANTDTGYVSASEGTPGSSGHSPRDGQLGLNTSFCSITVSGSSRERSPVPVLSRPGHCLHAFTYQTLDENEDEETEPTNAEQHRSHKTAQMNLEADTTLPSTCSAHANRYFKFVGESPSTCSAPADQHLKCVGESRIFLGSTEQEPFTPEELWSVDVACKDFMEITDDINAENGWMASVDTEEKEDASRDDAESKIGEIFVNSKEQQSQNLEPKDASFNNNEKPGEVSVTPSGIIQLPEGWLFFDMTPDNVTSEDHHSITKDTFHLLSEQKSIKRELRYTPKEHKFIAGEETGEDMDCRCCFCTIL